MDSFFLPLVAAALAEWGDKTQILALLLAARFQRPVPVLAAIALAALLNSLLAAFGGSLIAPLITHEARLLFVALALAFAGAGAFIPFRDPDNGLSWRLGAFLTTFLAYFILEFGDKTQFLTAGFGAIFPLWQFVALGATIGVVLGSAPAVLMGEALRRTMPMTPMRRGAGAIFLLAAAIVAINAFALI